MSALKFITGTLLFGFSILSAAETGAGRDAHGASSSQAKSSVPSSIAAEHEELHDQLRQLVGAKGKTGRAAKEVDALLRPHFVKEEQFALPPLRLLEDLAAGRRPNDADAMLRVTDKLDKELPQMLAEHKAIVAALQRLQAAAQAEGNQAAMQFAKALAAHATLEEQILYPAAQLVGRYLKAKTRD